MDRFKHRKCALQTARRPVRAPRSSPQVSCVHAGRDKARRRPMQALRCTQQTTLYAIPARYSIPARGIPAPPWYPARHGIPERWHGQPEPFSLSCPQAHLGPLLFVCFTAAPLQRRHSETAAAVGATVSRLCDYLSQGATSCRSRTAAQPHFFLIKSASRRCARTSSLTRPYICVHAHVRTFQCRAAA